MKSGFQPEAILLVRAATFLQRLFIDWNRSSVANITNETYLLFDKTAKSLKVARGLKKTATLNSSLK